MEAGEALQPRSWSCRCRRRPATQHVVIKWAVARTLDVASTLLATLVVAKLLSVPRGNLGAFGRRRASASIKPELREDVLLEVHVLRHRVGWELRLEDREVVADDVG